jgi:hypothetical protein
MTAAPTPVASSDDINTLLVEAVNARNDTLLDDVIDPVAAEEVRDRLRLMVERWPRLMLTRAEIGLEPVAAMWFPDERERYRQAGHLEVRVNGAGMLEGIDVVETSSPGLFAERPSAERLAEWERMETR